MLQIDMLEEPDDENDLIFLAHNEYIGGKYILVTKDAVKSIEQLSSVVSDLMNGIANAFRAAMKQ